MQAGAKRKGFVLTADALIAFLIAVALLSSVEISEKTSLDDEMMYVQAQDIVEACTILNDLNPSCFDAVKTESIDYCLNNCEEPMIKRDYVEFGLILK